MLDSELTISQQEFIALPDEEATRLITSRFEELRARGCDAEAAVVIAVHPQISIDAATVLVERGCAPRLVVRILS